MILGILGERYRYTIGRKDNKMRINTLLKRIQIAFNFVVYGHGKARVMSCGKCDSISITPITKEPFKSTYMENGKVIDCYWSEFTKCLKCGAVCKEVQMWNFAGEPEKLSDNITYEE